VFQSPVQRIHERQNIFYDIFFPVLNDIRLFFNYPLFIIIQLCNCAKIFVVIGCSFFFLFFELLLQVFNFFVMIFRNKLFVLMFSGLSVNMLRMFLFIFTRASE